MQSPSRRGDRGRRRHLSAVFLCPPVLACKRPATAAQPTSKTWSDHGTIKVKGSQTRKLYAPVTLTDKLEAGNSPKSQGQEFFAILLKAFCV